MINNHISFVNSLFRDTEEPRKIYRSMKAKADSRRTKSEKIADKMTSFFGSMAFLIANIVSFVAWIIINMGFVSSISPFDPFPFTLMTTVVSLEAIILAIFVLISRNRDSRVDDLREETHLQINIIAEREITKLMKMVALSLAKQGIDLSKDPELQRLIRPISEDDIEKKLEKEIF